MKYRGKQYPWYYIHFENDVPNVVKLFKKNPFEYGNLDGAVTTYWENEELTEKPDFIAH